MSTAATIIDRAARLLGQLNSGETCTAQEYTDGLVALNGLIDGWRNDRLFAYAYREESLTLVGSQSSYTIGPSGNLDTTRPIAIEGAYVLSSGNSYDVRIIPDGEYDAIGTKTVTSSWPDRINYRPSMPTGTLYTHPVSDGTSATLVLRTRVPLTAFSASTDAVSLPPGWEDAMAFNLAVVWAPEFQVDPRPSVVKTAATSKFSIQRANAQPVVGYTELPGIAGGRRGNILTGDA